MFLFRISKLVILCIFMIIEVLLSEPNSSSFSEVMLKGLNRLPWERVDVSFKKSRQRFFAHSTIQVCVFFSHSSCHLFFIFVLLTNRCTCQHSISYELVAV